jgi:hypothetical protein
MVTQTINRSDSVIEQTATVSPACHLTYNRDTWVKLVRPLSEYASDEGKLLCQESSNTWAVWVPDHGLAILDKSEFYC